MRPYSFLCLGLVVAGALACELKSNVDDSDSATDGSSSDGSGTDGMSTTSGDPLTSTGGSSITTVGTSATATATSTTADPSTTGMTSTTTVGTSMSGSATDTTTGDPIEPTPCEGPAAILDVATLAYLESQVPPMPDPTGGSSSTTGGDPNDPNTVFVRLSSQVATCADPNKNLECGPNWEVSIRIPPAFQTPGLYHLSGPNVTGSAFETGVDNGNNECSFGGGSFFATFELISIDDKSVEGRLCHVETPFFDNKVNLDGSFTAPRCP